MREKKVSSKAATEREEKRAMTKSAQRDPKVNKPAMAETTQKAKNVSELEGYNLGSTLKAADVGSVELVGTPPFRNTAGPDKIHGQQKTVSTKTSKETSDKSAQLEEQMFESGSTDWLLDPAKELEGEGNEDMEAEDEAAELDEKKVEGWYVV